MIKEMNHIIINCDTVVENYNKLGTYKQNLDVEKKSVCVTRNLGKQQCYVLVQFTSIIYT